MEEIITYKNLDWYIINETEKEALLFLKDCFTNEQIAKYFLDKSMVDCDYDVRFSKNNSFWFGESYIREGLNNFLNDLDIRDLNIMSTTISFNGKTVTTEDYVRSITKEEAEILPIEVIKTEREYGYWTITPWGFSSSGIAGVFFVFGSSSSGRLFNDWVRIPRGVRPVISLKSENLNSEITLEELIKMIYVLQNNEIDSEKWRKFIIRYDRIKGLNGSIDFQVLRNLFAQSLTTSKLKPMSSSELDIYIKQRDGILEDLKQSRKLILG